MIKVNDFSLMLKKEKMKIVSGINFQINEKEILGIAGESGCGKSSTALSIMGLHPKNKFSFQGEILFKGRNLIELEEKEMEKIRGKYISMIFQNPLSSLNPSFRIGWQIEEMINLHQNVGKIEAKKMAIEALKVMSIPRPEDVYFQYPHELSGGMRQRVMIAMAMINKPNLLIADEATTALDVTMQAQIIEKMKEMQRITNTSILFISHDLELISDLCQRVLIMYAGEIVEEGLTKDLFLNPIHPYTKGLLMSRPFNSKPKEMLPTIKNNVEPLYIYSNKKACLFSDRCKEAKDICYKEKPKKKKIKNQHYVFCHLYKDKE